MGHHACGPLELWNYPVWLENIVPQNIDDTDHPDHIDLASLDITQTLQYMYSRACALTQKNWRSYLCHCCKSLIKIGFKDLAVPRGHVWVIGAQNAGKSTLINALAKKGGVKVSKLTEAMVPGTTLGILRIGCILSAKAKMYLYLMSVTLNREEQKMVELQKELRPRTYRIKKDETFHCSKTGYRIPMKCVKIVSATAAKKLCGNMVWVGLGHEMGVGMGGFGGWNGWVWELNWGEIGAYGG
ncbi:GTP binding domain, P-loop containing nucleoside triphosphate hydrolase [Artemisia annua]|uniref:GTP binding domain, P-loop containing nucleoside triphosphate hydrolase n=1 Tax=Artemisia annua TaxID=35608 RepID=A0A2U1KXC9_ARTAN|nr:GTP binding domain, P-loop containing nucleoside triphosphate hydrolase [Artemisia annua]